MKRTLWFLFFLLNSLFYLYADSENDSLLKVLDKVISERLIYTQKKEATIKESEEPLLYSLYLEALQLFLFYIHPTGQIKYS